VLNPVFAYARRSLVCATWLGVAAACLPTAWAASGDADQPMQVEADRLRYEEKDRISHFTGQVVITKGSIVIRADQVKVRENANGQQVGVATGEGGRQAFFKQTRSGMDEVVEGQADRIEYRSATDQMTLTGGAVLRRIRAGSPSDEARGPLIVYDGASSTFRVQGVKGGGQDRVRAVLTPREKTTEPVR
jgi:lipopolysaccharide export system protein LptA